MSGRPINLPPLPSWVPKRHAGPSRGYARAAVEADRRGIVVTDEDVEAAMQGMWRNARVLAALPGVNPVAQEIAKVAYAQADAMIAERGK